MEQVLREIMTPNVEVIRPNALIQDAAAAMRTHRVGALPVCEGARLVGIVTDRDITIRATAAGADPRTTRVRDVMTQDVAYCFDGESIHEAARLMKERQIRRLPILNREQRLVGIVALGDLAVDTGAAAMSGHVLEQVSEQAKPQR
ncbi:MAG: CBS domain-containing protein [Dehalococcoidia bacterium]